jgi:hypothetical protein
MFSLMRFRRALWFATVAGLIAVAVTSEFMVSRDTALDRLKIMAESDRSVRTRTSGRSELALGAWYIFQNHPLGVGTGGFTRAWAALGAREGLTRFRWTHPTHKAHSGWAKILAENGAPGTIVLAAYVLSFAVVGWRTRDTTLRRLGLLVTVVLALAWVTTEFQNKGLWLVAAGAAVLLERHSAGLVPRRTSWSARA